MATNTTKAIYPYILYLPSILRLVRANSQLKKLLKNLSARYNKDFVKSVLENLEVKENARPHEIDASLYMMIYKRIQDNGRRTENNS